MPSRVEDQGAGAEAFQLPSNILSWIGLGLLALIGGTAVVGLLVVPIVGPAVGFAAIFGLLLAALFLVVQALSALRSASHLPHADTEGGDSPPIR